MIDRSHRVGPRPPSGGSARPILVKLTSYRHKKRLMSEKRKLNQADPKKLFPSLQWPTPAQSSQPARNRLFLNDDLTKIRAEIAAIAREKKRKRQIENTWVKDGVVFVKVNDNIHRVTTKRGMDAF
eukprot:TRINITY_DN31475_c0_g1_i5.p1 TRINITY_DN31475_c0_g1~~TRINITY_DN31475_c0_g1_i5.p1  ORF type:complete len:126 (-),score=36.06 TRINITY_DN31475_c0_g1_i5:166-543(-)